MKKFISVLFLLSFSVNVFTAAYDGAGATAGSGQPTYTEDTSAVLYQALPPGFVEDGPGDCALAETGYGEEKVEVTDASVYAGDAAGLMVEDVGKVDAGKEVKVVFGLDDTDDQGKFSFCSREFVKLFGYIWEQEIKKGDLEESEVVYAGKGSKADFENIKLIWNAHSEDRLDLARSLSVRQLFNVIVLADYLCATDTVLLKKLIDLWFSGFVDLFLEEDVLAYVDAMPSTIFDKYIRPRVTSHLRSTCFKTLDCYAGVNDVCFSHDGTMLATADENGFTKVWDVATGKCTKKLDSYYFAAGSVCFSHDDTKLLTCGMKDGYAKIWDISVKRCCGYRSKKIRFSGAMVEGIYPKAFFNSDSTCVLTGGRNRGDVNIWNTATGVHVSRLNFDLLGGFSPMGLRGFSDDDCVMYRSDSQIRYYNIAGGFERSHYGLLAAINEHSIAYNFNAEIINSVSGEVEQLLGPGYFRAACFNRSGSLLLTCPRSSNDHGFFDIKIWDVATGNAVSVLSGHRRRVNRACFNHNETMIAAASADGDVSIWGIDISELSQSDQLYFVYIIGKHKRGRNRALVIGERPEIDAVYDGLSAEAKKLLQDVNIY